MLAGTIVARNYLAQARVLATSFARHHPDSSFQILVIDGDAGDREQGRPAQVVTPAELGMADGEWEQMAGIYSVMEFATALKPSFLQHLLRAGDEADQVALYLDPDIFVYRPFPEVGDAARRAGIALTPHVLHPLPRDGLGPDESRLMHSGLFNLGFICVGAKGADFLKWWHERVRHDSVVDFENALFTDQRWVDWVPSLFDAEVLRDHGLNVAYWNLHERPLSLSDGEILAGNEPLKFFHFSGYDPDLPWQLSKHASDRPRVRLPESAVLTGLCEEYAGLLFSEGFADFRDIPYGLGSAANGTVLTPTVRAAYRDAVRRADRDGLAAPPRPFGDDQGDAFARWLLAPVVGPPRLSLGTWHHHIWRHRPDLQAAFPDPAGSDSHRLRRWFDTEPEPLRMFDELAIPASLMADAANDPLSQQSRHSHDLDRYGWNVIGYFQAELGVGEAGRLVNLAAEAAGIPTHLVNVRALQSRHGHRPNGALHDGLLYANSLYCVNADETLRVMALMGDPVRAHGQDRRPGRRIGLWFWEVDAFPDKWAPVAEQMDEIWCASHHCAAAISAVCSTPVQVIPLPVLPPSRPTPFDRQQLGLPEKFVFLFSYDFNSLLVRKNPLDLIEAYTRAFGPDDGACLVLKSINGSLRVSHLDRVRYAARGRSDIVVMDSYVDAYEMQGMIELSDCFVSLHRSEGFGLQLAMAMACGRPVIATGYSGNVTFMDSDSAFLVPFHMVPVGPGCEPYPEGASWAQPDLDAAAGLMRLVFEGGDEVRKVSEAGRRKVASVLDLSEASLVIGARLMAGWPGLRSTTLSRRGAMAALRA